MANEAPIIHVYDELGRPKSPRRRVVYTQSGKTLRNVRQDREGRLLVISDGPESAAIKFDFADYLGDGERLEHVELSASGVAAGVDYDATTCLITIHTGTPSTLTRHLAHSDYSPVIGLTADYTASPVHAEIMLRFIMSTRESFTERITIRAPNRLDQCQGPTHDRGIV